MKITSLLLLALTAGAPLHAGTVVVTSLPGEEAAPQSLRSFHGLPLGPETIIQLGAFPALSDDQVLDLATGGYTALVTAWVPFGAARNMGEGAGAEAGSFEIAVQENTSDSALAGQEISVLIRNGEEFLVARFKGQSFAADTETGLEQVAALQLRDARIIVGNRLGPQVIATSTTPTVGSYGSWIAAYAASITDETLRQPEADADGDGLSNFFEYATGGNPVSGTDSSISRISGGESGQPWFSFRSQPGLSGIGLSLGSSPDLVEWSDFPADLEWDPSPPDAKSWLRTRVPDGMVPNWFFRVELDE